MKVQRIVNTEELKKILLKYFNITDGNVSFVQIVNFENGSNAKYELENSLEATITENEVEPVRKFEY